MSWGQLVVVAIAIGVASVVQVLAGFGFSLLSMPIMTLAVPVDEAVVVAAMLGFGSNLWQSWSGRSTLDRRLAARMTAAAAVGMPFGLLALERVADEHLRMALGVSVLAATFLLVRRIDLTHVGAGLDVVSGFVSGVLNTSLSTNGPPLVFALQARRLSADVFRSTIAVVFVASNVVGLGLFAVSGTFTRDAAEAAGVAFPAWLVGTALAWPIRRHVHGERFRRLVVVLLAAAGLLAIVAAVR